VLIRGSGLAGRRFGWYASFMTSFFRSPFVLTLLTAVIVGNSALARPADKPGWKLTFDDEFDGKRLDLKKWNPNDPNGWERNNELQAYVTNAFEMGGGFLRIRAEKREAFYSGKQRSITSGMMTTLGKFSQEYGRFEIRCRAPKGKGMWPAFWLMPAAGEWPPEIDVLEILGHEPKKVYMTHHYRDTQGKHQSHGGSWSGPDFSTGFHEFAVEWSSQRIVWFVDGTERFRSEDAVPKERMYLLLNLAVGGDWPGNPDAQTKFPAALEVDYVRVYQKVPFQKNN
jgi:beta-glucanase (GH16 family)